MKSTTPKFISLLLLGGALLSACGNEKKAAPASDSVTVADSTSGPTALKPKGPQPEWGPSIRPEMLAVMEKLASYGDKPIETLNALEARNNHTPTDAVMDLMRENKIRQLPAQTDTTGKDIDVPGGRIHLRIYTPKSSNGPFPLIIYYHGGGFVIADLDVYDASAQGIAEQVNAVVVSVAYRKAPEHKFPTAHNDAFAAYRWALKNANELNADPAKVAVVGESAGGNLAANVSIMARDAKITIPLYQVLIYPIAQANMETQSYLTYAKAKPLNKPMMAWFTKNYLINAAQAQDPKISLVNADLKGLPSTTIITADIDPLHDDGTMLAEKLSAAGVKVDSRNYVGVTHEFFGMASVVPQAKQAQAYASEQLKNALR